MHPHRFHIGVLDFPVRRGCSLATVGLARGIRGGQAGYWHLLAVANANGGRGVRSFLAAPAGGVGPRSPHALSIHGRRVGSPVGTDGQRVPASDRCSLESRGRRGIVRGPSPDSETEIAQAVAGRVVRRRDEPTPRRMRQSARQLGWRAGLAGVATRLFGDLGHGLPGRGTVGGAGEFGGPRSRRLDRAGRVGQGPAGRQTLSATSRYRRVGPPITASRPDDALSVSVWPASRLAALKTNPEISRATVGRETDVSLYPSIVGIARGRGQRRSMGRRCRRSFSGGRPVQLHRTDYRAEAGAGRCSPPSDNAIPAAGDPLTLAASSHVGRPRRPGCVASASTCVPWLAVRTHYGHTGEARPGTAPRGAARLDIARQGKARFFFMEGF